MATLTEKQIENIARTCHEANRAFCLANGDDSQKPWDEAPEWQRDSAKSGVRFHLANPEALPSATHENWMAEKVRDGWKYGPVKDPEKKEHPCIVPFTELPEFQQRKDVLFRNVVHSFVDKIQTKVPFIRNCLLIPKEGDTVLFDDGRPFLDGYAIIPRQGYEEMTSRSAKLATPAVVPTTPDVKQTPAERAFTSTEVGENVVVGLDAAKNRLAEDSVQKLAEHKDVIVTDIDLLLEKPEQVIAAARESKEKRTQKAAEPTPPTEG